MCDFDIKFKYALAGLEGTIFDSRTLEDALVQNDSLVIPKSYCVIWIFICRLSID